MFKNLHKAVYIFQDVRNGHIPAERLMNILIDFCLTLNQTKLILNYMHVTKTTLSGETSANTSSLQD